MIYFIQAVESLRVKIGWTSRSAEDRLQDFVSPEPLVVLKEVPGTQAEEKQLHYFLHRSKAWSQGREWFEWTSEVQEVVEDPRACLDDLMQKASKRLEAAV